MVQRYYDSSKLLRQLSPMHNQEPSILTLAYPDETYIPAHAQNKKTQVREVKNGKRISWGRGILVMGWAVVLCGGSCVNLLCGIPLGNLMVLRERLAFLT